MVVLIKNKNLNPEDCYYYQLYDLGSAIKYRDVLNLEALDQDDHRSICDAECPSLSKNELETKIRNF